MKVFTTLILTLVFSASVNGEPSASIKIATYSNNTLQHKLGYQTLREFEYGEKYRNTISNLNQELAKLLDQLIATETDEDLQRVNLELTFIRNKISAIRSLAQTRANRGNDREELTALIKSSFSDRYALILESQGAENSFSRATYANIEFVDITDEIAELVATKLALKDPEPGFEK